MLMNGNEPLGILLRLVLVITGLGLFWGIIGGSLKNLINTFLDEKPLAKRHHHTVGR
jgi:hypothetical protein